MAEKVRSEGEMASSISTLHLLYYVHPNVEVYDSIMVSITVWISEGLLNARMLITKLAQTKG